MDSDARSTIHAESIWKTLARASKDKRHPWRTVCFCTAGQDGPNARSVILRVTLQEECELLFFTDARSHKVHEIQQHSKVSLLFWNSRSQEQLKIQGTCRVEQDHNLREALWADVPEHARRDYAALSTPGSVLPASPVEQGGKEPVQKIDLSQAFEHFTVLRIKAFEMDYLALRREGHLRYAFHKISDSASDSAKWVQTALVP